VDEADTHGLELTGRVEVIEDLILRGFYTYTQAEDGDTGEDLVRRPKNKYSLDGSYLFLEDRASVSLGIDYAGERNDVGGNKIESYTTVNLAASYDVHENFTIYGRIDNMFDEDYEEAGGYGVPGIAATIGGKVSF
jgi:vitamin B12 transporter